MLVFYRLAFGKDSIQLSKVLRIQSLLMGVVWMVYTLSHSRIYEFGERLALWRPFGIRVERT